MEILRTIPMDGTFDQLSPVRRLRGKYTSYSFDLKSATDRWPLGFMFELVRCMFGRSFASSAVNSTLGVNIFQVNFVKKFRPSEISFVTGQPLGYYASWALFAFSHHFLVWWCAERVRPGERFTDYAILGDDIIIADEAVAKEYELALQRLWWGSDILSKIPCL